jgi:hypothetical protein
MSTLTVVSLGIIALFLAAALYAAIATGRRMLRDAGPLRLFRLTQARGLALPVAEDEAGIRAVAVAARRCAGCAEHEECDRLLAGRNFGALARICPNTRYVDRLPEKGSGPFFA